MARSHLTLAALATSAVADLDLVATSEFGSRHDNEFDSACSPVVTDGTGSSGFREAKPPRPPSPPTSSRCRRSAPACARDCRSPSRALSARRPFRAPRAVVYEFVYGTKVGLGDVDSVLATSLGTAIAAIHNLPTSFVADAGLPVFAANEALRSAVSIMDRAAATRLVPATLLARWEAAMEDSKLWQFQPTVVNNTLAADSILTAHDEVTGILNWQELRVADPARDLAWLLASPYPDVVDAAFEAYAKHRGSADRQIRQRATLYSELEVAKWLLHGTDTRNTEIVDDAVEMLSGLVDDVQNDVMNPIGAQTMPTMAVDEVEAFLDRNERSN